MLVTKCKYLVHCTCNLPVDSTGKTKELWKALKSLGVPNKISVCRTNALKVNGTMNFETESALSFYKDYYSTIADNLLKKLPHLPTYILLTL